jgi:hypothetical protein
MVRVGSPLTLAAFSREKSSDQASPSLLQSDQVIRENPASRGTETSAEILVSLQSK